MPTQKELLKGSSFLLAFPLF